MIAIYYDDDCDALWISYRKDPILPKTLVAALNGDWIVVTQCNMSESILTVMYDQITDQFGNTFASAQSCLFYLQAEFLKQRPLGAVFSQATPSSVWTIPHALSFQPKALVIDTAGDPVLTDTRYPAPNVVELRFGIPTVGTAYLS